MDQKGQAPADDAREYPGRPIVGVGAVVSRGDTVLLIRRGKPPLSGEWTLPGGAIELGETMDAAIQREVREECGIEIRVRGVVDAIDILQRDPDGRIRFHYVVVDFAATYVWGDLRGASDVQEARWVTRGELEQYYLTPKAIEVIRKTRAEGHPSQ